MGGELTFGGEGIRIWWWGDLSRWGDVRDFSRWGDEQIFGWCGDSPHPPSRENPGGRGEIKTFMVDHVKLVEKLLLWFFHEIQNVMIK